MKLQAEYHMLCSNLVSSAIDHVMASSEELSDPELLQQVKALDLRHFSVPSKLKKSSISGLASPKTKHGSLKASLFSFFERKNSPEEGNSNFYVDIDNPNEEGGAKYISENNSSGRQDVFKNHVTDSGQSESVEKEHVTETSQSEVLVDLGLDPSPISSGATSQSVSPSLAMKNSKYTCFY